MNPPFGCSKAQWGMLYRDGFGELVPVRLDQSRSLQHYILRTRNSTRARLSVQSSDGHSDQIYVTVRCGQHRKFQNFTVVQIGWRTGWLFGNKQYPGFIVHLTHCR